MHGFLVFWSHMIVSCEEQTEKDPYSLKNFTEVNPTDAQYQNYVLYNVHLIVMMMLHCGIFPQSS